ncbi:RidA family protein [Brevibacillus ruminantium]|uniref:RidA family protein n=1 Tax=Brevibacillus ruminantium TaxID=2950604 RepID=A0ABY4WM37_9BACL|nr:RidA family protein [Brevibacillus ruminantium]USG68226.1 RidA family protein [Brevibacillus ruminantium]
MSSVEHRLKELDIVLPPSQPPLANYVSCVRSGNLIFTSGAGCFVDGQPLYTGRLGRDLSVEQGYEAAQVTALHLLSVIKAEIGSLDRVERIVKMLGLVSSADDFYEQPQVINGASDLLVQIFGEKGKHARSALGTSVLPMNLPVEIELIAEVKADEE